MSDYSQTTDFSAKDALSSGDPEKIILGADVDVEFDAISTAIASKYDSADLSTQAEAEAETLNTVLMTPLRVGNWADANGGMVGDIQALADPGADALLGWDDSASAAIGFTLVAGELEFVNATIGTGSNVPLLDAANTFTAQQIITAASASLVMRETGATADEGGWEWRADADELHLYTLSDAGSAVRDIIGITRSGSNVATISFGGADTPALDFNGAAVFSANITSEAGSIYVNQTAGQVFGWSDDPNTYISSPGADSIQLVGGATALATFAAAEIDLTATILDFNGAADFSSSVTAAGIIGATGTNSVIQTSGSNTAQIRWENTAAGADAKWWMSYVDTDGTFRLVPLQDDLDVGTGGILLSRTAATVTEIDLTATTLDFNGAADFSGLVTLPALAVSATTPEIQFVDAGGGSNEKNWIFDVNSGTLRGYTEEDDGTDPFQWLGVSRAGSTVTEIDLTATTLDLNGNTDISGTLTVGGVVSSPHTSAQEVGYQGAPSVDTAVSGNTAASSAGATIRLTGGTGQTLTLDSDPPEDSVIIIDNASGADWTIAASTTLIWATTGGTGSRTLADDGLVVALHRGGGVWIINGGGLS